MKCAYIGLVFVVFGGMAWGAERVPGTKVSLDAPEGFRPTTQFPGYMLESAGASIMVTEIPGPYSELSKGMSTEALAAKGMKLLEEKPVRVAPGEATLRRVRQVAGDLIVQKWMLVFGNEKESVIVVATFPEQLSTELSDKLRKSVMTVKWDTAAKVDFFEGLTFRVQEKGDMKIAQKVLNGFMLTRNGVFPQKDTGAPLIIVGSSVTENWTVPGDQMEYARARLAQSNAFTLPELTAETMVPLDGLDACVMEAEAKDIKTGEPLYVLHCLLFTTDGYYIFQGMVGVGEKDEYAPVFRAILKSFRRI